MKALKAKKEDLNRIVKDERLYPNRRMLAAMIHMYFDAQNEQEKSLFHDIIRYSFLNKSSITLADTDDTAAKEPGTNLEKEAAKTVRSLIDNIAGLGGPSNGSTSF